MTKHQIIERRHCDFITAQLIHKHYPSGDILTQLKKYVHAMRESSEKCRKEAEADGDKMHEMEMYGNWYAFYLVGYQIRELETALNP